MAALTPKQEKFCQGVVEGLSQSDAFRAAYDTSNRKQSTTHRNAKTLMDNSKIIARIEELRIPVIENCRITMEKHLNRLKDLSEAAEQESQYGAATKAEELRGKVCGLYTEKIEHSGSLDIRMLLDEIEADDDPLINE